MPRSPQSSRQLDLFDARRSSREVRVVAAGQLADALADRLAERVRVTIHDNRSTMVSFRRRTGEVHYRVHHMFLDAPGEVVEALAAFAGAARGGAARRRRAGSRIDAFVRRNRARIAVPRADRLDARGRVHDLQAIFDRLNGEQFEGRIEARIGWGAARGGRRRRTVKTGVYVQDARIIRIHPTLDRPTVPEFYVAAVVFHEMLHQAVPARETGGRRIVHGPEFRRRERAYPDHERAKLWRSGTSRSSSPHPSRPGSSGSKAPALQDAVRHNPRTAPHVPPARSRPRALLGAVGCVHGRGTQQEPLVDEVVLRGVSAVDEDELAEGLATRGPVTRGGFSGNLVRDRQRFEPDALPTDLRRIQAFYRDRGYYAVAVDEPAVEEAGSGLVKVVFRITEGARRGSRSSRSRGVEAAPEARLGRLPLRVGDVFKVGDYDAARDAIVAALRNNGWATAEVKQSAVVLPGEAAAEVRYEVTPGGRYRVGPIFVGRVAGISAGKIRDQISAVIETGEWWDESKLPAVRRRLSDLGVFGGVRVTRATPDPERGTIAVVIDLRQAKYQTIRAGPGLAFDPTRWDAELQVAWQHRNFYGDLRRLTLDVRGGYAWVPTPFQTRKEGPVATLTAEFQQPGAFTRWVDASVRAQVERGIEDAYDYVAERLRLGLPLRIVSRLALVPSVNFEVYHLSNTEVDDPESLVPSEGDDPQLSNCEDDLCLLAYLEQLVAWDARDNPLVTRDGWYAAITLQEGLGLSGYGYRYFRLQPELRLFYPVGRRAVLAFRARIGALIPINEAKPPPIVARFYAGGPLSMRGYYTDKMAPMVQQDGEWVPVGGNGAADGSIELRFDVAGAVGAAVFVDAAGVSDYSEEANEYQKALDPTLFQWAAGLGLRYRTPFGPLRLDVGVRLPNDLSKGVPFDHRFPAVPYTTHADGTPHREPIVAVQIALGEAF